MTRVETRNHNFLPNLEKEARRTTGAEQAFINAACKITKNKAASISILAPIVAAGVIGLGKKAEADSVNVCPKVDLPANLRTLNSESAKDTSFDPQMINRIRNTRTGQPFDPLENLNNQQKQSQNRTNSEQEKTGQNSKIQPENKTQENHSQKIKEQQANFKIRIEKGSTVDWEIEKSLKQLIPQKPSLFNLENPTENGHIRWQQTVAVLQDNNLTAEQVALVYPGEEFDFQIGQNLTSVLLEQGVSFSPKENHQTLQNKVEASRNLKVANQDSQKSEKPKNVIVTQDYSELEGKYAVSSQFRENTKLVVVDFNGQAPQTLDIKATEEPPLEDTPELEPPPEETPPETPPEATPTLQPTPTVTKTPPPPTKTPPPPTKTPPPPTKTATPTSTPPPTATPTPCPTATLEETPPEETPPEETPTVEETPTATATSTSTAIATATQRLTETPPPTPTREIEVKELPPTGTGGFEQENFNTGLLAIILSIFGILLLPFSWLLRKKLDL